MSSHDNDVLPVLIVGAGPIGLTMALSLTMRGIKCRIIDKAPHRSDKSKALGIHSRTLELLEMMGAVDSFLAVGNKVHATNICNGTTTLVHLCFDEMEARYPYALMVPQNESERLLAEHLEKLSVQIERQLELTNFTQDANGVTATIKNADGKEEIVKANWLLGCDGAHSTTRHILGLKFEGEQYEESFATADCYIDWDKPDDELFGFVNEDGSAFFFPMGNKRFRVVADGPSHNPNDPLTLDEMQTLVKSRCPGDIRLRDPNWLTWFNISRRSASQYRNGRVFIAGDAAHIHSPFMGQGMNTGMQDALNLAWKLELVEKGVAKPELLDTYQSERHPVGQMLLRSTDAVTKVVNIRNHIAQNVRNRLMPILASHDVVKQRAWRTLSMLGINYRNSSIVAEHRENLKRSFSHPISEMHAWFDFGHGPTPGDRAPDGVLTALNSTEGSHLFELFHNTKHNLLLFQGLQDASESIDSINKVVDAIKSEYGDWIRCNVVLSNKEDSSKIHKVDSILVDGDASLHHRYGAAHSCLYLVRPDEYVAYRSQPIELSELTHYLQKIFSAQTSLAARH